MRVLPLRERQLGVSCIRRISTRALDFLGVGLILASLLPVYSCASPHRSRGKKQAMRMLALELPYGNKTHATKKHICQLWKNCCHALCDVTTRPYGAMLIGSVSNSLKLLFPI